jgi:hypothetical protein
LKNFEKLLSEENNNNPYINKAKQKELELKKLQKEKIEYRFKTLGTPLKNKVNYYEYAIIPKIFDVMTSEEIENYMTEQRELIRVNQENSNNKK